ncbi:MAG TPA: DUF4167 domain-containing protein [Arenibaculum sp.]|nr:DUF4167 domain-containing protein [Arenibaculum sp.]
MRQGPNTRRSRGRGSNNSGRRQSNVPLRHQTFDSNGPDVRIRGNAFQVHEKYLALARDAQASGDRIAAENYLQHAEHYYRIIELINEQAEVANQRNQRQGRDGNGHAGTNGNGMLDDGGDDDDDDDVGAGDETSPANA